MVMNYFIVVFTTLYDKRSLRTGLLEKTWEDIRVADFDDHWTWLHDTEDNFTMDFNYFQLQFNSHISTQSPWLPNSWLTDARCHRWSWSWNLRSSVGVFPGFFVQPNWCENLPKGEKRRWGHQIMSDQNMPIPSFWNLRGHSGSKHQQLVAKKLTDRRYHELPSYSKYTAGKAKPPNHDTKSCLFHWPPLCPELTTQIFCHFHLSLASSEPSLRAIEGRWLGTTDRRGEPGPRGFDGWDSNSFMIYIYWCSFWQCQSSCIMLYLGSTQLQQQQVLITFHFTHQNRSL